MPKEKGEELARKFRLGFLEVSAKTNTNVSDMFFELVRRVHVFRTNQTKAAPAPTSNGSASQAAAAPKKKKGTCSIL